jgi:hypothetical protein
MRRQKMMDEIYGWFLRKRCGLWNQAGPDGRHCPILEIQRAHYRQLPPEAAVYYPESVSGNPDSDVIFLGINPGQTALKPNETEKEQLAGQRRETRELEECPNSIRDPDMELEAYVQRHLRYNFEHPREKVIAGATQILQETWRCSAAAALSRLAFMNVAHCKCPNYGNHFAKTKPPQGVFWNQCGAQTLKIISTLKPKAVVCLGGPVQYWAQYVHEARQPNVYAPWTLEGDLREPWYGRTIPLVNAETGTRVPLVMSYHPVQGQGKFAENAAGIVDRLREILFTP